MVHHATCARNEVGLLVTGPFRVSKVLTEPSAVAPDAKINLCPKRVVAHWSVDYPGDQPIHPKLTSASGATALGSVVPLSCIALSILLSENGI
jgi:hypothetical protein